MKHFAAAAIAIALLSLLACQAISTAQESNTVDVTVTGGYETQPEDSGRPIALIAAALGVTNQMFREAFHLVQPAADGQEPDPDQVGRNKQALLSSLGRYGVTNERLDEVSDYYRYRPGSNQLWRHQSAKITAVVVKGRIQKITIVNPGAGYCSTPKLSVPGFPNIKLEPTVAYGKHLKANGSISLVKIK